MPPRIPEREIAGAVRGYQNLVNQARGGALGDAVRQPVAQLDSSKLLYARRMPEDTDMTPEEVQHYLTQHRVLHLVHRAMNSAVRDCAANPLLHMARSLRANAHTAVASPPPPLQCTDLNAPSSPPPPATPPPADQSSRASCLTSSNGARLEPLVVGSESQLRELLSEVGVDTTEWLRLTTADLLAELRAGESTLCRTEDGGLTRVVSYCEVELLLRGRVLVLTHEESDGHARQQFVLPRAKMRAGEIMWQAAAHRAIHAALELPADTVALHMETHASESGMGLHASCPGRAYPALPAEVVRHFCHATLHPHTGEGAISGGISAERFCLPVGGAVGGEPHRRLHWGWYPLREWETVKRKKDLEARARNEEASRLAVGIAAGDEPRAKVRVRYDGLGELVIRDDELGPAQTQLEVVAQLYAGCSTVWYHIIAGGFSRAKILHVQAVDGRGQWQDPTICKLSPIELLRAEADAHAVFARYIGESVPQRIGEPVYVDEIGGMVLELVGACWRVPELAHTQVRDLPISPSLHAHLSPSLAFVSSRTPRRCSRTHSSRHAGMTRTMLASSHSRAPHRRRAAWAALQPPTAPRMGGSASSTSLRPRWRRTAAPTQLRPRAIRCLCTISTCPPSHPTAWAQARPLTTRSST